MRRLTIIRHARPEAHDLFSAVTLIRGSEIKKVIEIWNRSELNSTLPVPYNIKTLIKLCDCGSFISSELKRSKDTLVMFGIDNFMTTSLLNEPNLPYGIFNKIYLPIIVWWVLLKLMWVLGFSKNAESFRNFISRMENAANYLESISTSSNALVIGHSIVNIYLLRILTSRGWKKVECRDGVSYLSYYILEK